MDRKNFRGIGKRIASVALRKESVDRKMRKITITIDEGVALRKESVDRKTLFVRYCGNGLDVALRKESVDRKLYYQDNINPPRGSLSARRAWIEKSGSTKPKTRRAVALRKESVDRKFFGRQNRKLILMSLSARRAWIEKRADRTRIYT